MECQSESHTFSKLKGLQCLSEKQVMLVAIKKELAQPTTAHEMQCAVFKNNLCSQTLNLY